MARTKAKRFTATDEGCRITKATGIRWMGFEAQRNMLRRSNKSTDHIWRANMNYNHNDNRIIYICKNLHIKRREHHRNQMKQNGATWFDLLLCVPVCLCDVCAPAPRECASDVVCMCMLLYVHTFANKAKVSSALGALAHSQSRAQCARTHSSHRQCVAYDSSIIVLFYCVFSRAFDSSTEHRFTMLWLSA